MAGFEFVHRLCGAAPTIRDIVSADATLNVGDLVNLESGKADLAVTNDTKLIGVVIGPGDPDLVSDAGVITLNTTTDKVRVIVDEDAIYSTVDANARLFGATLDIAGATGAQGVATSSNVDVVVAAESTASEHTLVLLSQANHVLASS
jgi:hypothetical protein